MLSTKERLKELIKDESPQLYKDLKKAGELEQFLETADIRMSNQMSDLMKGGLNLVEAREIAWEEATQFPRPDDPRPPTREEEEEEWGLAPPTPPDDQEETQTQTQQKYYDRKLEKQEIEDWDPSLGNAYPDFINDDDEYESNYMEQTTGDRIWYAGEIILVASNQAESGFQLLVKHLYQFIPTWVHRNYTALKSAYVYNLINGTSLDEDLNVIARLEFTDVINDVELQKADIEINGGIDFEDKIDVDRELHPLDPHLKSSIAIHLENLTTTYLNTNKEFFKFSFRRIIPLAGIYRRMDFVEYGRIYSNINSELELEISVINEVISKTDHLLIEIDAKFLNISIKYAKSLMAALEILISVTSNLHKKVTSEIQYSKSDYDSEMDVWENLADDANYYYELMAKSYNPEAYS